MAINQSESLFEKYEFLRVVQERMAQSLGRHYLG